VGVVRQDVLLVADPENADERRAGLESRAEALFAFGQGGLSLLACGDVRDQCLDHLASAPLDPREGDLEGDLSAISRTGQPIKTGAAFAHAFLNFFLAHDIRTLSV